MSPGIPPQYSQENPAGISHGFSLEKFRHEIIQRLLRKLGGISVILPKISSRHSSDILQKFINSSFQRLLRKFSKNSSKIPPMIPPKVPCAVSLFCNCSKKIIKRIPLGFFPRIPSETLSNSSKNFFKEFFKGFLHRFTSQTYTRISRNNSAILEIPSKISPGHISEFNF